MPRKLLAVLVSSAFLWTSVTANASPAAEPKEPAQAAETQTATSAGNKTPLPPGPARIKTAQGLEDDDLGMGLIIASWAAAVAVVFLVAFSGNDRSEVGPPTTGTN